MRASATQDWHRLLTEAQRGDARAFASLVRATRPAIVRYLKKRLHDHSHLDDVLQEFYLKLHAALRTFDGGQAAEPWIFAVARSIFFSHLRKERSHLENLRRSPPARPDAEVDSMDRTPAATGDLADQLALLQAVDRLPQATRELIIKLKIDGKSIEEAAVELGTTEGAPKVRAHRAYKALEDALGEDFSKSA